MFRRLATGLTFVACFSAPGLVHAQQATSTTTTTVAAIRLENGYRASKIIGASVYNSQNQSIGTVSDLYMNKQNQISMVVISIGGVAGMGSKLVAVPVDQLQIDDHNKVVMADGDKDNLNAMPDVKYSD